MKFNRSVVFMMIGLAAALLSLLIYSRRIDFFHTIDLKLKDVRFRTRGNMVPDSRVVIIAIDARSINELGRWPWDRKIIAQLLDRLKEYGAKTVALDIVFSEPSNAESDSALAGSFRRNQNVIGGYFFRQEEGKPAALDLLQRSKMDDVISGSGVQGIPVPAFPKVEMNIPAISAAAGGTGFFNVVPDRDGIVRVAELVAMYGGNVYPSLPLAALRHYLGNGITMAVEQYGVDRLVIGNRNIPVDESGRATINYYGRQGTFRTIPAVDIIKQRTEAGALKGAIAFVGATEIGIADVRATPMDPVLPGIEVHATVASNVLQEHFLIRNGWVIALEILLILTFPLLLAIVLAMARRTITALVSFLAIMGIYFCINYFLFSHYFLNIGIVFPVVSISLTYLGSEAYRNLVEERQGRFLKKAFSSYVSAELVGQIIKNPDMLKLGGEKREITVLFSDIRGFTTLSEKLAPESLVTILNQYLGPMTNIILTHGGTLDKYIGDAIMALFNAPFTVESHSAYACLTAVEMMDRLKEVNAGFREKGLPEIDIGIGINTGDVIVGNMGTDVRFDYTAIGDAVNLASRLEGMTKIYRAHIIVSEFTERHFLGVSQGSEEYSKIGFRELDLIKVKGKNKPVTIYELSLNMNRALAERFGQALQLYREQRFREALDSFAALDDEYQDRPSAVFMERCRELINEPPGSNWDGVYVAKTK